MFTDVCLCPNKMLSAIDYISATLQLEQFAEGFQIKDGDVIVVDFIDVVVFTASSSSLSTPQILTIRK
jgi:hypothetical protein